MTTYQYSYKHKYGGGDGTVEAKNAEAAEKIVKDGIVVPPGEDGKPRKLEGLKLTIKKI